MQPPTPSIKYEFTPPRHYCACVWGSPLSTHATHLCTSLCFNGHPAFQLKYMYSALLLALLFGCVVYASAHPGRRATRRLISSRYVWKGLSSDVTAWAKACLGCQRAKVHRHVQVQPQHIPIPTRRFSHIHVDLVGPLPTSKGFTHLFTIMDRTSRWLEAIPLSNTTTVDCASALFQGWVSRY